MSALLAAWQGAKEEAVAVAGMEADTAYATRPEDWLVEVLGYRREDIRWSLRPEYVGHAWDGTPDPLAAICEALAGGVDVGVESATGTGKTHIAAGLALWFLACHEDALVVTTAPKEAQLTTQLWKEIGRHWTKFKARYPVASTVKLRVRMKEAEGESESWAVLGYACGVGATEESATKAQGFHAAHMLIVTEETPGIDPAVMTAFKNTCTGDHNVRLALGNPDHPRDSLHRFCQEAGVKAVRISALDHPNVVCDAAVIPGAVGRRSIMSKLEDYGGPEQGAKHPMYQSRVRGICPTEGTVPFPEAMVAQCDAPLSELEPSAWGWDLARAMDETVGIPLDPAGVVTKGWQRWAKKDWPEQVRDIVALCRGKSVAMDATGVGDPVIQFAQELGLAVEGYLFTDRTRQELLERLQGALQTVAIRGPFAKGGALYWITQQLAEFRYEYTSNGVRFKAPDSAHDDGAMGLALAVWMYDRVRPFVPAEEIPREPNRDYTDWRTLVGVDPSGEVVHDGQFPVGF
ncbi:MAG: hypothetical protein ACYC3F_16740 [Gemmatimonadaceae bacterium]